MRSKTNRRRRWSRVASVLVVGLGLAIGAGAQAIGPEIPIWIDGTTSIDPRVAFDSDHEEFLVVWSSILDVDTVGVAARRVSLDGSLGTQFPVVSIAGEEHAYPALAYNPHHAEYLVAWEFLVPGTAFSYRVLGSLISWDGTTIGSPFVIADLVEANLHPDVALNPNDDEYLVVFLNSWPTHQDIIARRYDGNGDFAGGATVVTSGSGGATRPRATFSPENDTYLIAYSNLSPATGHRAAVGKIAAPDLTGVGDAAEIIIADDPADDVFFPVVSGTADGFVSVYNLPVNPRARRLAPDGTPVGPADGFPLGLEDNQSIQNTTQPSAVSRADGVGYVAAWHQLMPTNGDVYAQAVSATSSTVVSSIFPVANTTADEREVDITCAPEGTCLAVYQRDENIVGKILRLRIFTDGFESGDTSAWN